MNPSPPAQDPAPARLRLADAVSIIVGIIIGASIFRSPADIYGNITPLGPVPAWGVAMALWLLVAGVSFAGALCYAELASSYPSPGGDYTFIRRAYGSGPAFLFAWSELSVIRAGGNISAMAYVFGDYAQRLAPLPLGSRSSFVYAVSAVLGLGFINFLGLRSGKWTQNVLTIIKVFSLLAVVIVGGLYFLWPRTAEQVVTNPNPVWSGPPSLAIAAVFVFYAYGGWGDAGYVVAELHDRRRNILRSLLLGVGVVTIIYLAVNAAYLAALGVEPLRRSQLAAADVMALPLGEAGAKVIALAIMISVLGGINGMIFAGMRLYGAFGRDERLFAALGRQHRGSSPWALVAMMGFSLGMMTLFETGEYWKPTLARGLQWIGIAVPENFSRPAGGFGDLVSATSPVYWLFFLMAGFALIVLRGRDPDTPRPYRVPFYPITPLLFCAASAFMLYQSTSYAMTLGPGELATVAVFVLLGIPLYACSRPTEEASR